MSTGIDEPSPDTAAAPPPPAPGEVPPAVGLDVPVIGIEPQVRVAMTEPRTMRFVRHGRLSMRVTVPGHGSVLLDEILPGDDIGITTLTKETLTPAAIALEELEVLYAPQAVIEDLVRATPVLARDLGRQLDLRRARQRELLTARLETTSHDGCSSSPRATPPIPDDRSGKMPGAPPQSR